MMPLHDDWIVGYLIIARAYLQW